jgi:hypothetical protein
MAETKEQLFRQAQNIQKQRSSLFDKPFAGNISGVNYLTEKMTVVTPAQTRDLDYAHPYVGQNSWIRSSVEANLKPLIVYRGDRQEPAVLRYLQEKNSQRILDYQNSKTGVYRPLRPGEHEIHSIGFAQAYYSSRAIQELRAGVIKLWLNQDELESGQKSPLHIRQFQDNSSGTIGDEIREGVVKRWTTAVKTIFPKINGFFAKEILTKLKSFSGNPTFFLYKREGQVVDDAGVAETHSITAKPLRLKHIYYTPDNSQIAIELDEIGNFLLSLPDSATNGGVLKIPQGGLEFQLGTDFNIIGGKGMKALFQNEVSIEGSGTAKLKFGNGKIAYGTSETELVDIISQLLDTLSQDTYAGFGAISTLNAKYGIYKSQIDAIKGTL